MWTIFRTSAAAGSSSFGDLKPSWIKNNNSILCGGAGRGTSADRGRHSNRKPSCNDHPKHQITQQLLEQEGKLWEKFLFSSSVSWLEKEISFVYKTRVSARSALPSPTISCGVGYCIRFFAYSTVISTLHRKISKNTKKCKSAVFKLFRAEKKKKWFIQKALNAAGAVSTGKVCVRSGVVAQPPSNREAGEDTSSRGRGVADVRQRATSLLCATPPPGFSGCERRTEFPGKKSRDRTSV